MQKRYVAKWLVAALGVLAVGFCFQRAVVLAIRSALMPALLPLLASSGLTGSLVPIMLAITELACVVAYVGWWRYLRPCSIIKLRSRHLDARSNVLALCALVLLGVGLQFGISLALQLVLPLFPSLKAEYHELMSSEVFSSLTLLSLLVVALGAPISEEALCRGVIFEFSLRAFCPELPPELSKRQFWFANIVQALLFGVFHLNVVQGAYAFVVGLVFGWAVWRTGRLWYGMVLHLSLNLSSYFVSDMYAITAPWGLVGNIAFVALLLICGFAGLFRATDGR